MHHGHMSGEEDDTLLFSSIIGIVSESPETPGDVTDDLLVAPVHIVYTQCTGVQCASLGPL